LFWLCCALWDAFWFLLLIQDINWLRTDTHYWHVRIHPAASVTLSLVCAVIQIVHYMKLDDKGNRAQS
jgi:hypothetical protein